MIKNNISKKRLERFAAINDIIGEKTAYAEGRAYTCFKDLSFMQIHIIKIIHYHRPCTMGKIAKSADLTMGSVTQIIDKLIQKRYAKRSRSPKDRRIVYAELTAKGRKVIEATKQHVNSVAEYVLSKLTESEQETLLRLFEKMVIPRAVII